MSNSLSGQSDYYKPESLKHSSSFAGGDSARQAFQAEAFRSRQLIKFRGSAAGSSIQRSVLPEFSLSSVRKSADSHDSLKRRSTDKHSTSSERSSRSHRNSHSSALFDKNSNHQAQEARKKHFSKYERFDKFKDGETITRESVIKRLPQTEALSKLKEQAKLKEGASKEDRLAAKEAKVELEMYYETNYRRVKYHGDKGLIAYNNNLAKKAEDNSEAQDAKNKCGHFKHIMGQIAGYGFNNGYSVVMGWMTSPGHRAEMLKLSNKSMGASQINIASTINFGKATA